MTARPQLLFVSPRFLFPPNEGGKIRTANILRCMKGGAFEVTLASPAPPDCEPFAAAIEAVCDRFRSWPQRPASRLRRLGTLFAPQPVSAATEWSKAGQACVAGVIAEHPRIIVVDFPQTAVLMPERPVCSTSVVFTHNVEAEIYERHAALARGLRRLLWRDQCRKMQRFEAQVLRRFDTIIAVSRRDADALQRRYQVAAVETIDTGVDLDFLAFSLPSASLRFEPRGGTVVFVGVMDSPANADGVTFLMDEIWPIVERARPQARALIVGRNPPKKLLAAARERRLNWQFTDFVEDVRPLVADAHVSVIPLRVGSGTRIKAFEAMAMGRPVVATPIGVEGLAIEAGRHYLAAASAQDFAAAILRLLDDAGLCDQLAQSARAQLEQHFSWAQVARQFETICEKAIARKNGVASARATRSIAAD